jgi:hypothetical protein
MYINMPSKIERDEIEYSPAQIRTGVKGSKGLYAWPLHSAVTKLTLPGFRALLIEDL